MKRLLPPGLHRRVPLLAGMVAVVFCLAVIGLVPAGWREAPKAWAEDLILRVAALGWKPTRPTFRVTVVDIDTATIARLGSWPWPRHQLAGVVEAIAARKPAALGLDLLLVGPDPRSLFRETEVHGLAADDPLVLALRARVPDGDAAMRAALARVPSVVGIGLDPTGQHPAARAQFLAAGPIQLDSIWRSGGAIFPEVAVPEQTGFGVLALPADRDGVVRRAPLVAEAGGALHPGLALDILRMAVNASAFVLRPDPDKIMVGEHSIPLPHDGMLRLAPGLAEALPPGRVSALELLDGRSVDLDGHLVILGVSAPEGGGLRHTSDDVLTPSVWLHALALQQMLVGISPAILRYESAILLALALAMAVPLVILPLVQGPVVAAITASALLALLLGGTIGVAAATGLVVNPLPALIVGPAGFVASAFAAFAVSRRQATRIRQRFEQHLSPEVVALIAANPAGHKLGGEKRMITALFTDVEDFTALTERVGPAVLVGLLDRYFEGVVKIVLRHGGTVDKIVGDAVHSFFNAPLDVGDHAGKALACARELLAWSESFRHGELAAGHGFGRTRIGIESGEAIVGDVGFGAKLDYTAHGYAVNAAARLEAANKVFGSSICIGPGAADLLGADKLRRLGPIRLQGFGGEAMAYSI